MQQAVIPDRPRVARCRALAKIQYPEVVATFLIMEMEAWSSIGYRFGRNKLVLGLMDQLERKAEQSTPAVE